MVIEFPFAVGPAVRVPGLFGHRVIYPVWLVILQVLLFVLSLIVMKVVLRAKRTVIHWSGRDPLGWFDVTDPPSDRAGTGYTIEDLQATHDRETARHRRLKRLWLAHTFKIPVVSQMTFLGLPTLVVLAATGPAELGPLLVLGAVTRAVVEARRLYTDSLSRFVRGLLELWLWFLGLWWVAILLEMLMTGVGGGFVYAGVLEDRLRTSVTLGGEYWVTAIDEGPSWGPGLTTARTFDGVDLYVPELAIGETARVIVASIREDRALAYPTEATVGHEPSVDGEPMGNGTDDGT